MDRTIARSWLVALLVLVLCANVAIACDADVPCDQCESGSEFSWNPSNAFITDRLRHFYSVGDELEVARGSGDDARAEAVARESLELAAIYRCNWNHGNATHDANRALGLIALKRGDVDSAERFLRASGKSTGSPQLDSFGPELDLADALLQRGSTGAVVDYLKDIQRFWKGTRAVLVDDWLSQIEQGGKPRLDRFAAMAPPMTTIALLVLLAIWPLAVAGGTAYMMRARIDRLAFYGVSAVVAGYAAAALGVLLGARMMAATLVDFPIGAVFGLALPLVAVVLVSRLFTRQKACGIRDSHDSN